MRDVTLGFVGDVLVDRDDPHTAFSAVTGLLAGPDLLFGNCEGVYSDTPHLAPSAGHTTIAAARNAAALGPAGFDVMSVANNHIVDGGHAAMLGTIDLLERQGIATCGAGPDLDTAWQHVVLTAGTTRVAYVACSSVFAHGYEARAGVPGLAPLRAHNVYLDMYTNVWVPGALPTVVTAPHEEDHRRLAEQVGRARAEADLVVVSAHWGDWSRPAVVTDHERRAARFAVDAGADVVVGHHHHVLRGVEFHAGKPIFYGLGHFVFDLPRFVDDFGGPDAFPTIDPDHDTCYGLAPRAGYPLLPMHPDSRLTALATVTGEELAVRLVPCVIGPDGRPRQVDATSAEGDLVLGLLRNVSAHEALDVTYDVVAGSDGTAVIAVRAGKGQP